MVPSCKRHLPNGARRHGALLCCGSHSRVNFSNQLFLSAVSSEFRRCREMLRADLSGPDMPWKVAQQADFAVGGTTLLEKLDRYISECSAVIHLIGDAAGASAMPMEVDAFLRARPNFLAKHGVIRAGLGDCHGLSYTQWEACMALDHGVPLYLFVPSCDFKDRQPGFSATDADRKAQEAHFNRLQTLGLDRGEFTSPERLASSVLRSLSGLIARSGNQAQKSFSESLEGFARIRESSGDAGSRKDATAAILPFHFELLLPSHLIVGQSSRVEFYLREPGHTPLEDLLVELEIGSSKVTTHCDLLKRGEDVRLVGDSQLIPHEAGTPPIKLSVICSRLSSLRERYEWKSFANVHRAEKAADISRAGRGRFNSRQIQFELKEETLRPRQGVRGIELRPVPAAGRRFEMGSPKTERGRQPDEDLHPVRFRGSWWMARHPVSQAQFLAVMGGNPSKFSGQSPNLPVECVTWDEAREFCERLTREERSGENLPLGFHYRLPTEAEWEFSCRAGETAPGASNTSRSSGEVGAVSHAICTFPLDGNRGANHFGLCDMTGNVFQWCLDAYGPCPQSIEADPCAGGDSAIRVIRGGSWHDPAHCRRPAARAQCQRDTRSSRVGFRVVLARV